MKRVIISSTGNKAFICPSCTNKTLYCIDHDVMRNTDVDYHDTFICDECGAELISEPQFDGSIKFVYMTDASTDIQFIECADLGRFQIPRWQVSELIKQIHDDIYSTASELLQTEDYGYDLNDISDMLFCDVKSTGGGRIHVELRAELSYDYMFELCQVCNEAITKYDEKAYFDIVDPGISEAFVDIKTASRNIYYRKH